MTVQALYCSKCVMLEVGGPLDLDDLYLFALEHPEDRGHQPRLIPLDQAQAIIAERLKAKGPQSDPCLEKK